MILSLILSIKYVREYVYNWLYIMVNFKQTRTINFIDCMCNAGVYANKVLGTPVEILKIKIKNILQIVKFKNYYWIEKLL